MSNFNTNSTKVDFQQLSERRREALAKIDNAEFGWFHIRACLVAGVGFFTDAYDLFAINLVTPMLGIIYFSDGTLPPDLDLGIKVAASIGTFIGQIGFGYLADRLGRKRMYGVELMIIIVATLGQALSGNGYVLSLPAALIIWRVLVGIGIGGDYPLSAVITSEFATTNRRGAMMSAVFAMQGFGYLTTGVVAIILLAAFKDSIIANPQNLDYVWRILIGFGCIPALVAVYFRLTIPETPRYVLDIENNVNKAERDVANVLKESHNHLQSEEDEKAAHNPSTVKGSFSDFCIYFSRWENFKILFGTSMAWFALDVAFYGIGLNNSFILSSIKFSSIKGDNFSSCWNAAIGQIIIVLLGSVPGYWVTVFTIERLGRIKIQLIGFTMSCILFCVLGFAYNQIRNYSTALFVFLFAATQFFQNFGPNATTFVIPGEVFPTRYRSTCHGIAAGSGKLGAIIAQVGFSQLKDRGGPNNFIPQLLQIFALFMFVGLVVTFFIPETKGKTLEELSNENENGKSNPSQHRNNALSEEEEK
ncbi:Inorganic phosphate transporter pho84 [Lobosporangium transversale]|uniref:Phosphate transporter n=1 Tax=Lobosporangium transversale TaxID=64571 RepID=A0A1Y2GWJ6_9FUNG|nr:phosphate transporter [Lobosporangium transversale]KAF9904051.1 Inorganic phosphate transporter pho84 [Lobosporangium transversale]ORZ24925.1 phosphate transporter [Lobosporangium transversale]|eukprot:XP_021883906.1 phosphate transporter [Lobosporangium transversale]